jgi:hypothetical protein
VNETYARWRGLKDLVQDAVDRGAAEVEKVHRESVRVPLQLLARVPRLAGPARAVAGIADTALAATYGTVRLATRAAGAIAAVGLTVAEQLAAAREAAGRSAGPAPGAPTPGPDEK